MCEPTRQVEEWANERAGMGGEENEHTVYFDDDDVDALGLIQVWDDYGDDARLPLVGFFGRVHSDNHEFRWDLSPDHALDLAAMLIAHAQSAREAALERALDDA